MKPSTPVPQRDVEVKQEDSEGPNTILVSFRKPNDTSGDAVETFRRFDLTVG